MSDHPLLAVVRDIRNWIRASSYASVKKLLEEALPDPKARAAYQMFDGSATITEIRTACRMSPNVVSALAQRCIAMGLMEETEDKRRVRLFDLTDFGLVAADERAGEQGKNDRQAKQ